MQIISEMGVECTVSNNKDCLALTTFGESPKAEMVGYVDQSSHSLSLTEVYPVDVIIRVRAALDAAFASEQDSFDFGTAVQSALRLWEEDRRLDRRTVRLQQEYLMLHREDEVA